MESYYIAHGTLLSVMCHPGWEGSWGRMDTCICMAESLHCSRETITTLLIDYTPIQNKKLKKIIISRSTFTGVSSLGSCLFRDLTFHA